MQSGMRVRTVRRQSSFCLQLFNVRRKSNEIANILSQGCEFSCSNSICEIADLIWCDAGKVHLKEAPFVSKSSQSPMPPMPRSGPIQPSVFNINTMVMEQGFQGRLERVRRVGVPTFAEPPADCPMAMACGSRSCPACYRHCAIPEFWVSAQGHLPASQ